MTLVVAQNDGLQIRIVSDTAITDAGSTRSTRAIAILKTIVLSPSVAVSFAGTIDVAQPVIEELMRSSSEMKSVQSVLLASHRENDKQVDYLVGHLAASGPVLLRITGGNAEAGAGVAWIGDHEMFERYQTAFHTQATNGPALERMTIAMTATVGPANPLIVAVSGLKGFRYQGIAVGTGTAVPRDSGLSSHRTAAEGGYNATVLTPREPGIGCVGVMYQQGGFGLLLWPQMSRDPLTFPARDPREFVDSVRDRYGVELGGVWFEPPH